jgi:hypothetical protein
MPNAVKPDEASNPMDLASLGAERQMLDARDLPNLVEESHGAIFHAACFREKVCYTTIRDVLRELRPAVVYCAAVHTRIRHEGQAFLALAMGRTFATV